MPDPSHSLPESTHEGGIRDPDFHVFLLLGQSNMEGIPMPEQEDRVTQERIRVLAYDDLPALGRKYNHWAVARPPLHSDGAGVGPGDYFARTLLAALPPRASVGLVPCAIKGVDIDFFRKDVVSKRRDEFPIPPDNHWSGAYEWVIERARLAQRAGIIRGILFHQGESDSGRAEWVDEVVELVRALRADLELDTSVPFVAGELLHDGCCRDHNRLILELPTRIANAHVVPAQGLAGEDQVHFDLRSQRELGRRFGRTMLGALGMA